MKMILRRFSAEAVACSGDARIGGQGTVFLQPQSHFSKNPQNHHNPDGPFNQKTPKSVTHLLSHFDRMLRSEQWPPIFEFCKVLTTLSRMGHHSKVLSLYREMGLNHVPVDLFTLNVVINSCCRLNCVGYGFSLYGAIVKNGHEPDAVTLTHLIKGLFLEGRGDDAVRLFQKSIRVCKPDVVTYATVIDGLCKMGNVDVAIGLFGDMRGRGCEPDTAIYNSICDGLCKIGRVDLALSFVGKMVKKGLSPDTCTSATLIRGLYSMGETGSAIKLLSKLNRVLKGAEPTLVTYGSVIDSLCKMGNLVAAVDLFRYMSRSYNPNAGIYTAIMDGLCKTERVELAFSFMGEMVKKGFMPNLVTFTSLIEGLFLKCEPNSALRLFYKLTKADKVYQPDELTYGVVIDGLCKMGDVDTAITLFRDMRGSCKPNIQLYTAIIDGLFKKKKADEASSLLQEMAMDGVRPDLVLYNVLLNGFCIAGKLNEARELFSQLSANRVLQPDVFTYNTMIHGLCQEGFLEEAKQCLLKMEEKGCKPDEVTFTTILAGFEKWNERHEAVDILERMVKMKFSPRCPSLS